MKYDTNRVLAFSSLGGACFPPDRQGPPMATVDEGLQAQIRNIEATYGKPMADWLAIIAASGLTKHTEVVAMLKTEYGMTHSPAHRVSLVARQAPPAPAGPAQDGSPAQDGDPAGPLNT